MYIFDIHFFFETHTWTYYGVLVWGLMVWKPLTASHFIALKRASQASRWGLSKPLKFGILCVSEDVTQRSLMLWVRVTKINLNVLIWDRAVQMWDKLFRWWSHDWASSLRWYKVLSGPLDRAPPSRCQQMLKTETYVPWWGSRVSVVIGLVCWLYVMYNTSVLDTAAMWIRTIFQLFVHLDPGRVSGWHCTEPSVHLTITCLRVFTARLIEITCFLCSKFWFWTTDENKRQNSSHTERLCVCIKTSCAFENDPPDNYKEPHQLG